MLKWGNAYSWYRTWVVVACQRVCAWPKNVTSFSCVSSASKKSEVPTGTHMLSKRKLAEHELRSYHYSVTHC